MLRQNPFSEPRQSEAKVKVKETDSTWSQFCPVTEGTHPRGLGGELCWAPGMALPTWSQRPSPGIQRGAVLCISISVLFRSLQVVCSSCD